MSIEYSTEVKQVAAVFKEYRNTIDIYTEDKDEDKAFYELLLKRLLDGTTIKINDIHPLGNKENVINACKNDTDNRRHRIYIVDGDIYLQYKTFDEIEHLFRLDSYCIENYVLCENSVCQAAYELNGGRNSIEEIKKKIDFDNVLIDSLSLVELFFWYSIQCELFGYFRVCHVDSFLDSSKTKIDVTKIEQHIATIKQRLLIQNDINQDLIDQAYNNRTLSFEKSKETLLKIVSGKNFLVPLFCKIIYHKVAKIDIPKESWKYNFSKSCDLKRLENLKQAIIAEANSTLN